MKLSACLEGLGAKLSPEDKALLAAKVIDQGLDPVEAVRQLVAETRGVLDRVAEEARRQGREVVAEPVTSVAELTPEQLQRIEQLPPEKLFQLEDLQTAEELIQSIPQTDPDDPARRPMQDRIARELYGNGAEKKNREVWLVLGPPASGKSSLIESPEYQKLGALVIDSDMAEERIPEFRGGIGANAVHQESKRIAARVLVHAIDQGDNIIEPLVGANKELVEKRIEDYKKHGYTVHLRLVDLPVEKTLKRAVIRYYKTRRYVPLTYITEKVGYGPVETFHQLVKEKKVDDYAAFSSDVPQGEKPVPVERIEDLRGREVPRVGARRAPRGTRPGAGRKTEGPGPVQEFFQSSEEIAGYRKLAKGRGLPKLKKVLPKEDLDFLYEDIGHPVRGGRIVGAPTDMPNTKDAIAKMRLNLWQLAKDGEPGRLWYERSSQAILEMAGGNVDEAEKIVSLVALYSPHATVAANTAMALTAYYQWKAGRPIRAGLGLLDAKAEAYLREGKDWAGRKTNNFYRNLMVEIDPARVDTTKATMDMWMAVAFDYGSDSLDQGPKYDFAESEINHLAEHLGWTAHQVQAAIWVAAKARWDMVKDQVLKEELRKKIRVKVKDPKTGKITTPFAKTKVVRNGKEVLTDSESRRKHFHLAYKRMMEVESPDPRVLENNKYDFSDAFEERTVQISWEALPSKDVDDVPGLMQASFRDQLDYLIDIQKSLTGPNGEDLIAEAVGLATPKRKVGPSAWEGHVGAGAQDFIPVPLEGSGKNRDVKPAAKEELAAYAALRGWVLRQDAVVWHVPIWGAPLSSQNGVEIRGQRTIDRIDMVELYRALEDEFGTDELAPAFAGDRVRILNFVEDSATEEDPRSVKMHFKGKPDVFFRDDNWNETRLAKSKYTVEGDTVTLKDGVEIPEGATLVAKLSNKDMQERISPVIDRLPEDWAGGDLQYHGFRSAGDFIGNDWKENPNGEAYQDRIGPGRPDVLRAGRDLRARVEEVNRRYRSRIGSGLAEDSGPARRAGPSRYNRTDQWAGPDGLVPLTHWGKVPGLTTLDPSFAGTAAAGLERRRVDKDVANRLYFGLPGYVVEPSVKTGSRYRYMTKIDPSRLYDIAGDPDDLRRQILERKKATAKYSGVVQTVESNELERMLLRMGYAGYWVDRPWPAAVIFEPMPVQELKGAVGDVAAWTPEEARAGTAKPYKRPLYGQSETKRGSLAVMADGSRILKLGEASDLTTFLHESAHLFLEFEGQLAREFGMSDLQRSMLDWLGVSSFDEITPEMHERWAETFEAYLMEGKSPTRESQKFFDEFKRWLIGVYRTLTDPRLKRADLSPEIRAVFDRLLAAEVEIERVSAGDEYQELFRDPERAGLTDDEWERLQKQREKAKARAKKDLEQQLIAELRKRKAGEWAEARAPLVEKYRKQFSEMPIYKLFESLKTDPLDRDAVIEILGKVPRRLREYVGPNGQSPEEVAGMLGFPNAKLLLESMVQTPTLEQAAFAAAEAELMRIHGDTLNDGTVEQEAQAAMHNSEQAKLLLMELKALNKKAPEIDREYLKHEAKKAIGSLTYRQIKPWTYHRAEVRAAKEATKAKTKEEAYLAKLKQLTNFYLFKEALAARKEVEKIRKYVRNIQTREYPPKQVHPQYIHYLKVISRAYEMRATGRPRDAEKAIKSLMETATWMRSQINEITGAPLEIYDPNIQALIRAEEEGRLDEFQMKSWDNMTLEELRALKLQLQHLRFVGGQNAQENRIKIAKEGREAADAIRENAATWTRYWEKDKFVSKVKDFGMNYGTMLLFNAETLLRRLDGFKSGVMVNKVLRPIHEAMSNKFIPALEKAAQEMDEIIHRHYTDAQMRAMNEAELFDGIPLTKWQRIMVAMNWGTESNRQAILDSTIEGSKPFTPQRVEKILDSLDENDWQFVQDVWNHIGQFKEPLFALQRRMTGVAPPAVDPAPVKTKYGTLPGGYFPLHYDKSGSWRMTEIDMDKEAQLLRAGSFASAQTPHGMTMARVGSGGNPVLLDPAVWQRHVVDVLRHVHLAEPVAQVQAILASKDVAEAINETGNQDILAALDIWLKDVAAGEIATFDSLNRLFRHLRTGVSVTAMGFNVGTMLMQPLGLFQSMPVVGYKATLHGLQQWLMNPKRASAMAQRLSPFMKERAEFFNKDIHDTLEDLHGKVGKPGHMPRWFRKSIFGGIVWTQRMVDTITWMAVFDESRKTMSEADAVFAADRAVARSQASGAWPNRTPIERGTAGAKVRQTEVVKVWSTFGSYMFAKANVFSEVIGRTNFHDPKDVVRFVVDTLSLFALEAVVVAILRNTLPDDDENKAAWFAKQGVYGVLGTVPVVREFGSELQGFRGQSAIGASAQAFGNLMKQIEQGEPDPAMARAALKMAGITFHLPTAPANRVIDAASRDDQDVTWADYLIWREHKK